MLSWNNFILCTSFIVAIFLKTKWNHKPYWTVFEHFMSGFNNSAPWRNVFRSIHKQPIQLTQNNTAQFFKTFLVYVGTALIFTDSSLSILIQSCQKWKCWHQRILKQQKKGTSSGPRSDDHWIKSLILIHLS